MEKKPIWDFIQIGTSLKYLEDTQPWYAVITKGGVRSNIKSLLRDIQFSGLEVTDRACQELYEFLEILNEIEDDKRWLTGEESQKLRDNLKLIRHTLNAETRGKFAFIPTEKRYDQDKLMNSIDKIFPENIFSKLSPMAQFDISEAGKCIALERPTAASFHLMRGLESILRTYHHHFIKKDHKNRPWGPLLNDLKGINSEIKPEKITIDHLFNIKDNFRNPTQHPEKIYTSDEAQDLLNLCIEVIARMINEISQSCTQGAQIGAHKI